MNPSIAPGVFDILPFQSLRNHPNDQWRSAHLWNFLESMIQKIAAEYGYEEMRTPIFEPTELFKRTVGEATDIVSKEMYTFLDKSERSMTLRPEGTAAVVRAFLTNKIEQTAPIHKFYYIGPMFRYERAQAGRFRQHHQFGVEVIGSKAPEQDVEIIDMLYTLYQRLGLKNLQININSIGDVASRTAYKKALVDYLKTHEQKLSADSQTRLLTNPLRILDSKDPQDIKINEAAPSILDFLNEECSNHFNDVQALLKQLNIPFQINTKLVRGLDYYNKTVFEIIAGELGSQNSLAGGGRYDGLLKTLGGPDLPATGFATGLERVIQTMIKQNVPLPSPNAPELFLIALGEEARKACFNLLHQLRQNGISTTMEFSDRKINKAMQYADQIQAAYVAVIGENELKSGIVELKDMSTGEKRAFPLNHLASILSQEKKNRSFSQNLDELSKPFANEEEAQFFMQKLGSTIDEAAKATENLKKAIQSIQEIMD